MFTSNPFATLSASVPPAVMQAYVVVMIVLVVGGVLFDVRRKKIAAWFFDRWRKTRNGGTRRVGAREILGLAVRTALADGLTSAEFGWGRRRIVHLITMYGFLAYVVATVVMVFWYPTPATPAPSILPRLWAVGALLVCVGCCWFWFLLRVDVAAEGRAPFRVMRADLFVLSLLAGTASGLVWAGLQAVESAWVMPFLGFYVVSTAVLFGSVPWSKFAHMFYKPATALERRLSEATGARRGLPAPAERSETLGSARERPRHY